LTDPAVQDFVVYPLQRTALVNRSLRVVAPGARLTANLHHDRDRSESAD
jgi:hypothetical protein